MTERRNRLIGAFARRRIPPSMLNWEAVGAVAIRAHDRHIRKRHHEYPLDDSEPQPISTEASSSGSFQFSFSSRERLALRYPGFDIEALRHYFVWLVPLAAEVHAAERTQNLAWLRQLLGVSLRMLPDLNAEDDAEVGGTPYGYDQWTFHLAASFVVHMTAAENPDQLWRPILELGAAAHYWVEMFLGAWTVSTVRNAPSPSQFFDRWKEMIEFAMSCPVWASHPRLSGYRLRQLWEALLGMGLGAAVVGVPAHEPYFVEMIPLYRSWAERFLNEEGSLRAYLRLLNEDGARSLLCPSLPWLLRAAEDIRSSAWARDPIADELAVVLRRTWTLYGDSIATDANFLSTFSKLLNLLVKYQSNVAMDLRERVSKIVPTA